MNETDLFTDDELAILNRFVSTVWGNAQAVLRRFGPRDTEFIDLEEYFSAIEPLFAGALKYDKILVREEYHTALLALETDMYIRGAYVTGQPGIGKTLFLVYLLVTFLGQKRAVALQFASGRQFYALFKDSVTFHSLDERTPLVKCGYVWALSDSNNQVNSPSGTFLGSPSHIRVIQVTSPKTSRWKEWSKQVGARCYVMDIWSKEELADLAMLLEQTGILPRQDVERMATLAKSWGNVPRTLLQYICEDDQNIERRYRAAASDAVKKCGAMVDGALSQNFPDEAPLWFYFVRPFTAERIERSLFSLTVPTRILCSLLGQALQGQENLVKLKFFSSLSLHPDTRQAAGYIYESWFHSFLAKAKTIQCHWMQDSDGVRTLRGTTTLIPATKDALKSQRPPYYWVTPRNFPGIDSILVFQTEIFAFQVTLKSDHTTPLQGLRTLRSNLPNDLKDLLWRVVFVGAEEEAVRAVAAQWVDKVHFPTRNKRVPIGWSTVDPVQSDVAWKVLHDEADSVSQEGQASTSTV